MATIQPENRHTVMIVDDDLAVKKVLQQGLKGDGRNLLTADNCGDAFSQFEMGLIPEVVILDLSLPGMGGLEFLNLVRKRYPFIKAIVVSADNGVDTIVEAMRLGALDFIPKPFRLRDVCISVNETLQYRQLQTAMERRNQKFSSNDEPNFLCPSKAMAEVMSTVKRVASTSVPVFITGESGVGKELVAREIHQQSDRNKGPFVQVNCAALPANLLEGELFGFEKGAFTGAVKSKPARFERANNGTLFLDEIGELEHGLQAKLLHVLQDGSFSRLGSNKTLRSKARIIVATNRNIEEAVSLGDFRSDLYYRINVIRVHVKPLRERQADIMPLADLFLARSNQKFGKNVEFCDESREYIMRNSWPGNVRELQNAVSRYVVLGKLWNGTELDGKCHITPDRIGSTVTGGLPSCSRSDHEGNESDAQTQASEDRHSCEGMTLKEIGRNAARQAESKAMLAVLEATRWNKSKAARVLKISYKALLYKIKDCSIEQH